MHVVTISYQWRKELERKETDSTERSFQEILRNKYLNGELDFMELFKATELTIEDSRVKISLESWSLDWFTSGEIKEAGDSHYLENLAIEKSEEILEKEEWENFVYFYSDESREDYGLTLFYRVLSKGV